MSDAAQERSVRRIVVALGGEGSERPTLEALAELAASLDSELAGLFVEDVNLLRLADLPFARELSRLTSMHRPLQGAEVERQLKVQAVAAERLLATVAERAGAIWSFRVARGRMAVELLSAAKEANLIALGAAERALPHRHELWEFAESLSGRRRPAAAPADRPVAAVFSGSAAADRALAVAVRFANSTGRRLVVFIAAATDEESRNLQGRAAGLLGEQPALVLRLVSPGLADLLEATRAERSCTLVVEASTAMLERSVIEALREHAGCSVLLVR